MKEEMAMHGRHIIWGTFSTRKIFSGKHVCESLHESDDFSHCSIK